MSDLDGVLDATRRRAILQLLVLSENNKMPYSPFRTRLRAATSGAALIEYGLLVGLIAVTAIGAVSTLGQKAADTYTTAAHALSGATELDGISAGEGEEVLPPDTEFSFNSGIGLGRFFGFNEFGTVFFGSHIDGETMFGEIGGLYHVNDVSRIVFAGNAPAETSALTLTCDEQSYSLAGTVRRFVDVEPEAIYTQFQWSNDKGPKFVGGRTYTCSLSQ